MFRGLFILVSVLLTFHWSDGATWNLNWNLQLSTEEVSNIFLSKTSEESGDLSLLKRIVASVEESQHPEAKGEPGKEIIVELVSGDAKNVDIALHDSLVVKILDNPLTGSKWVLDTDKCPLKNEVLRFIGDEYAKPRWFTLGRAGKHIFKFEALKDGEEEVCLKQMLPSGQLGGAAELTIKVTPPVNSHPTVHPVTSTETKH